MAQNARRSAYYSALLNENRMLVDYIAAHTTKNIAEICLKDTRSPLEDMTIGLILSRLDEISSVLESSKDAFSQSTIAADDAAFLQTLRDTLNRFVRPASSLTIAYTALVTGSRRGRDAESRETLARDAFGGLISSSFWHRWTQRGFVGLGLLITLLAVRESSNVALGRAYMQDLANLHAQQASIALEKAQVEALAKPIDDPDQLIDNSNGHKRLILSAFTLCDRKYALAYYLYQEGIPVPRHVTNQGDDEQRTNSFPGLQPITDSDHTVQKKPDPLEVHSSQPERDVCGRDYVLQANFQIAHDALQRYETNWPEMMGLVGIIGAFGNVPPEDARKDASKEQDIEYILSPVLLVWGNYILPVIFGLLVSCL
jgi:hypothetical protein